MSWMSIADAENFHMYSAILMTLIMVGLLDIDGFILDINCQFSVNLARNQPELFKKIRHLLVGWLHSNAGHKLACQVKFSGLYRTGTGRAVGEQTEQLNVSCTGYVRTA